MKAVFLGCTKFSEALLQSIISTRSCEVVCICTIPEEFKINYSDEPVKNTNYANLEPYAKQLGIPHYSIQSEVGKRIIDYLPEIEKLKPDVILVLGWYYMVPKQARQLVKHGAWGIHASLLPNYAGGAPLVWAIIEGQKTTGVTLFRLDEGVDNGDIILQEEIEINELDYISDVYDKATKTSERILNEALKLGDQVIYKVQDKSKIKIYPQRKPSDGEIDLSWDAKRIYDFVRAQAYPYPGAFIKSKDGKKIFIDKARLDNE